jgi:hypothetical protein
MTTPAIPPEFIKIWGKMKATAPELVKKAGKGVIPAADRKQLSQDTIALFKNFDQGLKKTLEKANKAKDAASAKKVLLEIKTILAEYERKTTAWGKEGDAGLRAPVTEMVTGNLEKMGAHVTKALAKLK